MIDSNEKDEKFKKWDRILEVVGMIGFIVIALLIIYCAILSLTQLAV